MPTDTTEIEVLLHGGPGDGKRILAPAGMRSLGFVYSDEAKSDLVSSRPLVGSSSKIARYLKRGGDLWNAYFDDGGHEVVEGLTDAVLRFIARTGRKPTRMYLGADQHDKMRELAARSMYSSELGGSRLRWRGMEIFQVDAVSHVGFGADD
ncbi:MAG TPA: hypothetical protein VHF69_00540 [Candidatus Synoicihabitans sp.]|nr:hypothetical protein [Candidatus Synoicihabitans sp.]